MRPKIAGRELRRIGEHNAWSGTIEGWRVRVELLGQLWLLKLRKPGTKAIDLQLVAPRAEAWQRFDAVVRREMRS